jgi:hypothetical protein
MTRDLQMLAVGAILAVIAAWSFQPAKSGTAACGTGYTVAYDGTSLGCAPPSRPVTTVSGLPTCNSAAQGIMYFVTDALAPVALATIASGGAVKVGVICNGTAWIVQ